MQIDGDNKINYKMYCKKKKKTFIFQKRKTEYSRSWVFHEDTLNINRQPFINLLWIRLKNSAYG